MSTEANKTIVEEVIEEAFVHTDEKAANRLFADDFTPHSWPGVTDKQGFFAAQKRVAAALTDISMTIDDLIAEGDKVVARITARGTHTGDFMGMPASGKSYQISETHIFRLRDGKVVEHWRDADMLGMMKQLGTMPARGS
jgi:steroid delta-isomerase-like uncharacterized protein